MKIINICTGLLLLFLSVYFIQVFAQNDQVVQDNLVLTKVKTKIASDPSLSGLNVDVNVNNNVVLLAGVVEANSQASRLVEEVAAIDGVNDIDTSKLLVRGSNQPMTDTFITAKVKGLFIRNKLMGSGTGVPITTVNVETTNGVVYLTGTVDTKEQADEAVALAQSVKGVKGVDSKLQVGGK